MENKKKELLKPKCDIVFQALFAENKYNITQSLISDILGEKVEIIDIKNWDTSNVITFYCMFYGCSSLTSLDLSNWNTSNLTDMSSMFANCSSLIELDLSNFDTSKVKDMKIMFQGCTALTNLNISNFNLNKTTDFHASGMFDYCNSLNFDCIDTSNMDYESLLKISTIYENRSK